MGAALNSRHRLDFGPVNFNFNDLCIKVFGGLTFNFESTTLVLVAKIVKETVIPCVALSVICPMITSLLLYGSMVERSVESYARLFKTYSLFLSLGAILIFAKLHWQDLKKSIGSSSKFFTFQTYSAMTAQDMLKLLLCFILAFIALSALRLFFHTKFQSMSLSWKLSMFLQTITECLIGLQVIIALSVPLIFYRKTIRTWLKKHFKEIMRVIQPLVARGPDRSLSVCVGIPVAVSWLGFITVLIYPFYGGSFGRLSLWLRMPMLYRNHESVRLMFALTGVYILLSLASVLWNRYNETRQ